MTYPVQYSTAQYRTVQYSTVQYNTIQYNTIQYNTIQYCYMFPNQMKVQAVALLQRIPRDLTLVLSKPISMFYSVS